METKERIKIYADIKNGKTVCICMKSKKSCKKNCECIVVERDKFSDWKATMYRNRYGQ